MLYTFPHYYNQFQCIASACQDTCCAGWAIMIDEKALEKYRSIKGPMGNRLKNSIDWTEGSFRQYGHRCAFLNEENLCDLYAELGKEALCHTCRTYPRHIEEFEGCRELSLCLSCMEAAKIILGCKEKVRFLTKEDGRQESYEEFDFLLYTKLMDARDLLFEILQNRSISIRLRMSEALALGHDLERRLRLGRLFEADTLFKRYRREDRDAYFEKRLAEKNLAYDAASRFQTMKSMFSILREMEPLKPQWPAYRDELEQELYGNGPESYSRQRLSFLQSPASEAVLLWSEQLMVYFVFTYFCGAVYNGGPYGKLKLAVGATLLMEEFAQALWQKSGSLGLSEMAEAAHRFSRELEHSDENRALFEERLMGSGDFGLKACLRAFY